MRPYAPARPEESVGVGEGGRVLAEVAVERRREALERHLEDAMQALEDGDRQRPLQAGTLVRQRAETRLKASAPPRRQDAYDGRTDDERTMDDGLMDDG